MFALVPDVLEHAVQGFGLYQSSKRTLDPVLRELAQTRAGWTAASQFVFSQHCKSLRALGVSEEKIAAIPHWSAATCFEELERLVLAYTDCLVLRPWPPSPTSCSPPSSRASGRRAPLELTYITGALSTSTR